MEELLKWWIPGFTVHDMELISSYHDCFITHCVDITLGCQNKSVESKADHQHSHYSLFLILHLFAVDYLYLLLSYPFSILKMDSKHCVKTELIDQQEIHFLKKPISTLVTKQLIRNEGIFEGLLSTLLFTTVGRRWCGLRTWWQWHHRSVG